MTGRWPDLSTAELHWLVGILEGEGCFTFALKTYKGTKRVGPRRYAMPAIKLQMTDEDVVARSAHMLGARYHRLRREPPRKDIFATAVSGSKAAAIMRSIAPYMGKRRAARIAEVLRTAGKRDESR